MKSTEPLFQRLNKSTPNIFVPVWIGFYFAHFFEYLYLFLIFLGIQRPGKISSVWDILKNVPFLTRAELFKASVTHTFSSQRAQRSLGWKPAIDPKTGRESMMKWLEKEGYFD